MRNGCVKHHTQDKCSFLTPQYRFDKVLHILNYTTDAQPTDCDHQSSSDGLQLHGHLVTQRVRQTLCVQNVEEPRRSVGPESLRLAPAVPVVAFVRVGLVLRADARLPETEQLQGSQDLLPQQGAVVAGRLPGVLALLLAAVRCPGRETEALQPNSAAAERLKADVYARRARGAGLGGGGEPGAVIDLQQGRSR